MKKHFIHFSGITLLLALLWGCNYKYFHENLLVINDYRNKNIPANNIEEHKSGDVEIYRGIFIGEGYRVIFFNDVTGELISHEAFYGVEEDYDQAKYEWKNDTTVIINLINSITGKEVSFEVSGKGRTTGIRTYE